MRVPVADGPDSAPDTPTATSMDNQPVEVAAWLQAGPLRLNVRVGDRFRAIGRQFTCKQTTPNIAIGRRWPNEQTVPHPSFD